MKTRILKFPEDCTGDITNAGMHNLRYLVENFDLVKADFSKVKVISSSWLRWLAMASSISKSMGHEFIIHDATEYIKSVCVTLGYTLKFE